MASARRRLRLKRAYEPPARSDGHRILVDRVWPRGITKAELHIEDWVKELAPSTGLRKWFGHEPSRWPEFKKRYFRELTRRADVVDTLLRTHRAGTITLLFAAKDVDHNNAVALKEYIERRGSKAGRS